MISCVEHDITITGSEAELDRFLADCFSKRESGLYLDFNKLCPLPAEIRQYAESEASKAGLLHPTSLPDWYVWIVRNWGTESNARGTKISRDSASINLHFETAWSIPWPIWEVRRELSSAGNRRRGLRTHDVPRWAYSVPRR